VNGTFFANTGTSATTLQNTSAGQFTLVINGASSAPNFIGFYPNSLGSYCGRIYTNDNSTTVYATSSDARLKRDIVDISNIRDIINSINPKQFSYINDASNMKQYGFIAQNILASSDLAYLVGKQPDGYQYYDLDYSKFSPIAIAGVKELYLENEAIKARLSVLEAQLTAQTAELSAQSS
jgi:hypothetical protein